MSLSLKPLVVALALSAVGAWAQTPMPVAAEVTPPPMVPATPPPMPAAEPGTPAVGQPGTPPPPSVAPPSYVPGQQPSQSGYQYSPYGQPQSKEKPGPEIGLMVSESLFGMLTAAGITVLPYFLLFGNGALGGDSTLSSIIFILIFSAAPLAVAQTQVGLANGSRYWMSETWPAAIAGLVGEAAVLGLYYATGWLPTAQASGGVPTGGSVPLLLIGAIGVVPLIQMAVINLFKQPKYRPYVMNDEAPSKSKASAVTLAMPSASPIFAASDGSPATGLSLSLLRGTW